MPQPSFVARPLKLLPTTLLPTTLLPTTLLASTLLLGLLLCCACSSTPPPPPKAKSTETEWVGVDTGRHCAKGKVACGLGNCAANVTNRCKAPVTCELTVQCVCEAYTGESGEALGRAKETIAAGDRAGVLAHVLCGDGEIVATHAQKLRCR